MSRRGQIWLYSLALAFVLIGLIAAVTRALAQGGPLQQGGAVTPGHIARFVTNGVVGDGGSAQNGTVTEIGINNSGTPFCIADAPTTGPYHQLCLGANFAGNGIVSYQAYNGATVQSLLCNINGVIVPCELSASNVQNLPGPLTVAGNITTPGVVQGENLRSIGDSYIGNTLWVTGLAQAENLQSRGDSYINGTAYAGGLVMTNGGGAIISGNLVVQAPGSQFQQGLVVTAAPGQLDALYANGDIGVTGLIQAENLQSRGDSYIGNNLSVTNNVNATNVSASGTIQAPFIVSSGDIQGETLTSTANIFAAGSVYAGGIQLTSDARLKTDVRDFKIDGVDAVKRLRPVSYQFEKGAPQRQIGLIADEVVKIVPQAVGEHKGVKTLDPMALIDVLITANKELAERLEALEKRVGAAH